ncbi:MAG: peroxiredoxin [Myxococcales bacterium]|nr:peroxiredoxin [Myxococcales bacterium]
MTIQIGDSIPDVKLNVVDAGAVSEVSMAELCAGKKVVLFGLPGAFTPTCSSKHLPGFVEAAGRLKAAGADLICCLSVNDAMVMKAWAKDQSVDDRVLMLADGSANLTRALGLEVDLTAVHMGVRSQRYLAILDDGVVSVLQVEKPRQFEVSSAEAALERLQAKE